MLIDICLGAKIQDFSRITVIDTEGLVAVLFEDGYVHYYFNHEVHGCTEGSHVLSIPSSGNDCVYTQYRQNVDALMAESIDWVSVPYCDTVINTRKMKVIEVIDAWGERNFRFGFEAQGADRRHLERIEVAYQSESENQRVLANDVFKNLKTQNKMEQWAVTDAIMYRRGNLRQLLVIETANNPDRKQYRFDFKREFGVGSVMY